MRAPQLRAALDRARQRNTFTGRFEGLPNLLAPMLADQLHKHHDKAQEAMTLFSVVMDKIARGDADAAANYAARLGMIVEQLELALDRSEDGAQGGRPAGETALRDMAMAKDFQQRQGKSGLSSTALMADIGKKHGLKSKSAAQAAIKRGLRRIMAD